MKRAIIFLSSIFLVFAACKKEDNVSKVVTVSYPVITLQGQKYVSLHVGENYTDPGASSFDNANNSTTSITAATSTLDINTPGLYYMLYTATNVNGYSSNVARYIAVTDYPDTADLSGTYVRTSNNVSIDLTRVARGLYQTSDMGGAGLPDVGYFAVINDTTIDFGPQFSETLNTEIYGSGAYLSGDTLFSYILHAPGYGTSRRIFIKQ